VRPDGPGPPDSAVTDRAFNENTTGRRNGRPDPSSCVYRVLKFSHGTTKSARSSVGKFVLLSVAIAV
jgi:hypothetical protein